MPLRLIDLVRFDVFGHLTLAHLDISGLCCETAALKANELRRLTTASPSPVAKVAGHVIAMNARIMRPG